MLLRKTKLDVIEILISKAFINSYISHEEFVSVNNVNNENTIRWSKKFKNAGTSVEYIIQNQWKPIAPVVKK